MRTRGDLTLKTAPGPFRAIWRGEKTAEFRNNDRDFQVNDAIELLELGYDGNWSAPYRRILIRVTHMQTGFGIPGGYVMLSFKVVERRTGDQNMRWARCANCKKVEAALKA